MPSPGLAVGRRFRDGFDELIGRMLFFDPAPAERTNARGRGRDGKRFAAVQAMIRPHPYSTRERSDPSPSRVSSASPDFTSEAFLTMRPSWLVML